MPLETGNTIPTVNLCSNAGVVFKTGKPAVLSFVKSSCPTCALTLPYLDALDRVVSDSEATVAAVSQDQATATAEFAGRCNVSLPMLDDSGLSVSTALDVQNVPTTFLLDAEGTVQDVVIGLDKAGLNRIAATLSAWTDNVPQVIAPEDDGHPAWQPG